MKFNTYLADHAETPWPFATGQLLPFPYGTVQGAGVCVTGGTAEYAGITALSATTDEVLATFCVKISGNSEPVVLGTISVTPRDFSQLAESHGSLAYDNGEIQATAWLAAGPVVKSVSCATLLKLDSSCVLTMPENCAGSIKTLDINGVEYAVPEKLSLVFDGYLQNDSGLEDGLLLISAATPSNNAVLSVLGPIDYQKVTGVNEIVLSPRSNWSGELRIKMQYGDGTSAGGAISAAIANAVDFSSIDESTAAATDVNGDATILTLHGNHSFPNCYTAADDEA